MYMNFATKKATSETESLGTIEVKKAGKKELMKKLINEIELNEDEIESLLEVKKPEYSGIKKTISDIRKNCNGEYHIYMNTEEKTISGGPDEFFPEKNQYEILSGNVRNEYPTQNDILIAIDESINKIEATKKEIEYYEKME